VVIRIQETIQQDYSCPPTGGNPAILQIALDAKI